MKFKQFVFQNENWTPQNLFFHFATSPDVVLLESGRLHPATGRYSILGLKPTRIFQAQGDRCRLWSNDHSRLEWQGNPFSFLDEEMKKWGRAELPPNAPPFAGGAIGFLGYEALRWTEPIPLRPKPGLDLPDLLFLFFDWALVFDHRIDKVFLVGKEEATEEMVWLHRQLMEFQPEPVLPWIPDDVRPMDFSRWQSNFSKVEFCAIVERAKEYIAAGDIFQANLSRQLQCETASSGRLLYETLSAVNPSPFAAYLKTPEFEVISCSPERLVSLANGVAETRPIAGTRPRAARRDEDEALARELQVNEKERAEHVMLLDLERNDLGKVCRYGLVEVNDFLVVENYSHVRHLVSNVRGRLAPGQSALQLLKALFPGGTITGTPKVRSMQIIDELETVRRHLYTGSLGYFSYTGNADFNILIRTLIKKGRRLYLGVGAGIVADSNPEREFEETGHKARALMQTVEAAEGMTRHGSHSLP